HATRYALDVGLDAIAERSPLLGARLREGLSSLDGVRVLDRGRELCAIVTFTIDGRQPDHLKRVLDQRGINSALSFREYALYDFSEKNVDWCLRLSPHYYNTEQEVEDVVGVLQELTST